MSAKTHNKAGLVLSSWGGGGFSMISMFAYGYGDTASAVLFLFLVLICAGFAVKDWRAL